MKAEKVTTQPQPPSRVEHVSVGEGELSLFDCSPDELVSVIIQHKSSGVYWLS